MAEHESSTERRRKGRRRGRRNTERQEGEGRGGEENSQWFPESSPRGYSTSHTWELGRYALSQTPPQNSESEAGGGVAPQKSVF
jgi:hypothetical protein